jgi:hypothetical protein
MTKKTKQSKKSTKNAKRTKVAAKPEDETDMAAIFGVAEAPQATGNSAQDLKNVTPPSGSWAAAS